MGASKVSSLEREQHAAQGERWCGRCEQWLETGKFSVNKSTCKRCHAEVSRQSYRDNPDTVPNRNREKLYGVSPVEFKRLMEEQDGCCVICKVVLTRRIAVDHDHGTKEVRGLLCLRCNPGIGYFKDSPELLRAAAEYLEQRNCVQIEL